MPCAVFFFFNDTATTEIYPLSLHDALPIWAHQQDVRLGQLDRVVAAAGVARLHPLVVVVDRDRQRTLGLVLADRSEEHTSELQSRQYLVCRLLLEKKKKLLSAHEHLQYRSA